jgi:thymidine phosphorylase
MVAALGGPADLVEHPGRYLPSAPVVKPVFPASSGTVSAIDTRAIGLALIELGGGRRRAADKIDHRVGFSEFVGVGKKVGPEQPICLIHAADGSAWARVAASVREAVRVVMGGHVLVPGAIHQRITVD